ncbi:hypothetical protein ABS207_20355, partial [Acinetobacter baumannii]|uniref:hypothetical protein n=1 Tax=Acinetobacter baumannii TaxID=470 RepID=UPI0033313535
VDYQILLILSLNYILDILYSILLKKHNLLLKKYILFYKNLGLLNFCKPTSPKHLIEVNIENHTSFSQHT